MVALGGQGLAPADLAGLRAATDIVLLLDNDAAGQAEAARLRALLGPRARIIQPPAPAKDLADLARLPDGRARLAALLGWASTGAGPPVSAPRAIAPNRRYRTHPPPSCSTAQDEPQAMMRCDRWPPRA